MKKKSDRDNFSLLKSIKQPLRIMKTTVLCLFLISTGLFATEAFPQVEKVTLSVESSPLQQVLASIEDQTNYLFVYNKSDLDVSRKVSVHAQDKAVAEVLSILFGNTGIVYAMEGTNIMLMKSEAKLQAQQQQNGRRITGVVTDPAGETIIGANISVQGTTIGTITDLDGKFELTVPPGAVLNITYIGYLPQEIAVGDKTSLNIVMKEDSKTLDEVVIVGYGTQKKVNLTGAISQVDAKVFETRPVTSVASALQGALPGVLITPKSGNPNEESTFNVRGTTSINGGGPLILVDGVESSMDLVNPNDIQNVTVLKDAAASSIYGVRAAFGVILVTTKKGTTDGLKINYSGNLSFSKATVMPEFVDNSYTHASFVNDALSRENSALLYEVTHLAAIKDYYENPAGKKDYYIQGGQYYSLGHRDWVDMLIKDFSPKHSHNVSVSGGSGKTTFYSSVGYTHQEGMLKINPDIYQRTNARLSVENQNYDWMKLGLKAVFNTSKMDEPHKYKDDIFHSIVFSSPLRGGQWMGDPDYPQYNDYIGYYFEDQGPDGYLKLGGRNITQNTEILLSPSIDLYPLKNWTVHADFSYSRTSMEKREHRKKIDKFITNKMLPTEGSTNNNSYQVTNSSREYSSFNAYTDYQFTLKEKHNFKVMAGFNQEVTTYKKTVATRKNLLSQELPSLSIGSGEQTVASDGYEWALRGGFGRINYDYDNRYLLEVNGRYDGTSRFPKDDRFVFLPSFSLGWRLSEESFMNFAKPLFNSIKLRASYGELGNQLLSSTDWDGNAKYYPYLPFFPNSLSNNYVFGNAVDIIISPPGLVPPTLTWEKSATINGGIDITLLDNRLDMSFDVYRRTTSDMLISQTYPELLGTKAPVSNSGTLQTNGWELSVNWRDRIGQDFSYSIGLSLYDSQAKITKYDGPKATVDGYYVGKKIGEIWGYETIGFFESDDDVANSPSQSFINTGKWTAGDIKYKDRDGSKRIDTGANTVEDPGDRFVIGNETPRYNYGITLNASYKGFFANMFFQGVGKRDFFPTAQAFWPVATQYFNTQKWFVTDSWSEDNRNAYFAIPRARNDKNRVAQTKYLQDASYVRLKNLTVGYTIPKKLISKLKLSNAQVYLSGENLWEHSNVKGPYDPEGMSNKGSMYYPFQRTYSIGIDLTF